MRPLTICQKSRVATGLLAALALAAAPRVGLAAPEGGPTTKQEQQIYDLHMAGLRGDRSQVPAMIAALNHPPHSEFLSVSLVALSRLGATEALPAIDKLIADPDTPPYYLAEAKVDRARLVAEDAARGLADPKARAAATVRRFYQELGLTPDAINSALADPQRRDTFAVPTHALDALADMVYRDGAPRAFLALPDVSRINFAVYDSEALKVRLAVLPRKQRIATMVSDLVNRADETVPDLIEMQLLADEGADGADAAADKIASLDAHPDPTLMAPWRTRLHRVLQASGDVRRVDVIKDPNLRAKMQRGEKHMVVLGD